MPSYGGGGESGGDGVGGGGGYGAGGGYGGIGSGWGGNYSGYTTGSSENQGNEAGNVGGYTDSQNDHGWTDQRVDFSPAKDSQEASNALASELAEKTGITQQQAQTAISATNGLVGEINPGGVTYSAAKSLSDQGIGNTQGVNTENPTQSADEAVASKNFNDNIAPAAIGMLKAAVPYAGLAMSAVNQAGAVASGQKTLGGALAGAAVDFASNYAAGKINSALSSATDGFYGSRAAGLISSAANEFGYLGIPNVGKEVVGAAMDVSKSYSRKSSDDTKQASRGWDTPGWTG